MKSSKKISSKKTSSSSSAKKLFKPKKNAAPKKTKSKFIQPSSWSKVKIAGNLVTNDGGGLEGLIGLEVLEDYNNDIMTKGKLEYKKNTERKANIFDDEDVKKAPKKKKKPVKKVIVQKKKKVDQFAAYGEEDEDTDDDDDDKKVSKKKKKSSKNNTRKGENGNPPNSPGQFVRVNSAECEEDDLDKENAPEDLSVDDLEEWKSLGVPDQILRALAEKGYKTPTQIQSLTLPAAILGRKDILGAAETGSGKTLAFGIPILSGIFELKNNGEITSRKLAPPVDESQKKSKSKKPSRSDRDNCTPPPEELNNYPTYDDDDDLPSDDEFDAKPLYALVLTPTRELAVQVKNHLVAVAKHTGIQVVAVFGGLAHVKQERILKKCPEIVVATPGRLWELINEGNRHLNKLDKISYLVIDETDRMVEKGHFEELKLILDRLNINPAVRVQRQNFVFSATLTLVHELPTYLKSKNMSRKKKLETQTSAEKLQSLIEHLGISQPKIVDITQSQGTAKTLTECRIICDLEHKDLYLYYFLQRHPGRTIVFCNSIDCVKRLGQLFGLLDCKPKCLHAHMNQKQRLKNLEKFTENPNALLIATDVAARGLDIPNVQHVIHYQVPRTSENYIHRSGRTARAQKEGITVLIMEPGEIRDYVNLCKTLQKGEDLPIFPVSDRHLKAVKARVDAAREVDLLQLKSRRSESEIGWIKKAANEMDIIVDDFSDFSENDLYDSDDGGERYKDKRILKQKRDSLNRLLSKQLFPKGFSYKYPTSTGKLEIPLMDNEGSKEDAVSVMKTAIEDNKTAKKRKKTF